MEEGGWEGETGEGGSGPLGSPSSGFPVKSSRRGSESCRSFDRALLNLSEALNRSPDGSVVGTAQGSNPAFVKPTGNYYTFHSQHKYM